MRFKLSRTLLILNYSFLIGFCSCSVSKQISKQATTILLNDTAISTGHIGISIYEPATNTYWYNYNATKNFIPASNTKLLTLYAGMKYLGDSLVGMRYEKNSNGYTTISGTGDPTFLHPDYPIQPVYDFLKKLKDPAYLTDNVNPRFSPLGKGWAWDDYQSDYMAERSEFPIYGNVVKFFMHADTLAVSPLYFYNPSIQWQNTVLRNGVAANFRVARPFSENSFHSIYSNDAYLSKTKFNNQFVPFKTMQEVLSSETLPVFIKLLADTLNKKIGSVASIHSRLIPQNIIHSQPSDSLFKPMMHRSDNFFAEQTLLMASNEYLGYMSDEKMIDTILKTSLNDLPQKPKWVDGSGLSRYNLCTPQTLVFLLNKIKTEFGWERVKNILPTGGTGTLSSYYKKDSSYIYAKTGTLSNNCALSGYLITQQGKFLIFSVLANNYQGGATPVRKAVEQFLLAIRKKY